MGGRLTDIGMLQLLQRRGCWQTGFTKAHGQPQQLSHTYTDEADEVRTET